MKRARTFKSDRSGNRKRRRVIKPPTKRRVRLNQRTGGFQGAELKYADTILTATALVAPTDATGGEVDATGRLCLIGIAQGDTVTTRIGNRVTLRSIYVDGMITCAAQANQTATDIGTKIFIAMVLDTQTNLAQVQSELVYSNPSTETQLAASPLRNLEYSSRFRVLKTVEMYIENPSITYDGTNLEQSGFARPWKMYANVEIPMQFATSGSTVTAINDNSLHMIAFCSSTALAPMISYNARARFTDK